MEAAGGKLIEFYGTVLDGPGAMAIFDIDPAKLPAITAVITASGKLTNVQVRRLITDADSIALRQIVKELLPAYKQPGG